MKFLKLIDPLLGITYASVSALLHCVALYMLAKHCPDLVSDYSFPALVIMCFITADYLSRILDVFVFMVREIKKDFTAGVKNA